MRIFGLPLLNNSFIYIQNTIMKFSLQFSLPFPRKALKIKKMVIQNIMRDTTSV